MREKDIKRLNEYHQSSSSSDEEFVIQRFLDDSDEESLKSASQKHWEESSEKKVELGHVLRRIHNRIDPQNPKRSQAQRIFNFYSRIAAILVVPLLIAAAYFSYQTYSFANSYTEIQAPAGSRVHFSLPDGSAGVLNGGSNLRYAANFKNERDLQLDGEAYFEVTRDKAHPFTVITQSADVQVLGTKFDVCAYDNSEEISTTLEEGSVRVFNKQNERTALLKPGEQNIIQRSNGNMITKKVETSLYTSWRNDILKIDNTPFEKVVKLMERWYGVSIQLDPDLKYSQTYTLTIKAESLREMLQLLKITTPFNYQINGNKVTISKLNS